MDMDRDDGQQLRKLLRTHGFNAEDLAKAADASLSTVLSWVQSDIFTRDARARIFSALGRMGVPTESLEPPRDARRQF